MEHRYTNEAYQDLDSIEDFLLNKWNLEVLLSFHDKLNKTISIIKIGNVVFENYENTRFHKLLITKYNTFIYTIEENTLIVHRILQNFQNPDENYKNIAEK